jgi:polar amino acid transport system substrate-binding protein
LSFVAALAIFLGSAHAPLAAEPHASSSDTLDAILARGYFTYGSDEEGGGPYIYPDPADPKHRIGFEVELADELAHEMSHALGRTIDARFQQGQWDKLPDLLDTGRIDIVLSAYEWMPERARKMESSVPYFVYELQWMARKDDAQLGPAVVPDLAHLSALPKKKVAVLGGSAAERYVAEQCPNVEAVSYDGSTNAMWDVQRGRVDATLQDTPIAIFYSKEFKGLRFVADPVAPGRYVIYARKGETRLRDALDRAIVSLRDRGVLKTIYERYGLWSKIQEDPVLTSRPELPADDGAREGSRVAAFIDKHGRTFLEAAAMTVLLSFLSMPIAIALGILIALGRLYGPKAVSIPLAIYVEVLRGTPLMLQLFVIFYVFPNAGVRLNAMTAAVMGLAINYSAYEAEIYRAGILAVPRGQMEAALALGMSKALAIRRIIVPQAVRIVIPPVTNDFIALFKDTSVCSVITVVELTKRYNIAAMTSPSEVLPLAATAAALYLAMSYPLSILSAHMERKLRTAT